MSRYRDITTASFDDDYMTTRLMFEQLQAEGETWDTDKRKVWVQAIRLSAEGLIRYYERGTNPLGFAPHVVKASKTKIRELREILDKLPER